MTDVLNSEWLKLRSVRSTTYVLLAIAASLAVGALVSYLMTADWDTSPPDVREKFGAADPSMMVVPFTQFCLGVLGALAITAEYGSGMIRTTLVTVPQRRKYLLAKVVVVAGASLGVGAVTTLLAYQTGELITGDRPEPISAYGSFADALPALLANTASLVLLALLGLALGFILRSTAGTLVTLCALLFVVPSLTMLLPEPWDERAYSITLPALAPQLSGEMSGTPLSPPYAALTMLLYVLLTLTTATITLHHRDA
ncbi:ABC transporter permease [Actinosynnema sp. NPDC059335]|uniref:ABC transporter permease n=1 Tax=Actinosynnema sp. NPDC059335 TaxID=3346804 RepID=UPI0036732026